MVLSGDVRMNDEGSYGIPRTRGQWIEFLVERKAVPYFWQGEVCFRRVGKPLGGGVHIFGKKTRKSVAKELDLETKEDCDVLREEIKARIGLRPYSHQKGYAVR